MAAPTFAKLAVASIAANGADQMMLALLPLVLVAADADAQTVSTVVAAHAAAWLIVSLPVGAYSDTMSRRRIMIAGAAAILLGSALGGMAAGRGAVQPWALAASAFVIASGVVMLILSVFALVPQSVVAGGRAQSMARSPDMAHSLARSNATLEFGRAVMSIVAPIIAAALTVRGLGVIGYGLASAAGLAALVAAMTLPREMPPTAPPASLLASIRDGAAFVVRTPVLRAIAVCAVAWNCAFFALAGVFAPYAHGQLAMNLDEIGYVWSIYGVGLLLGSLAAAPMIARLPTSFMFIFGPATSALAVLCMVLAAHPGQTWPVAAAFFCLGFGPMTWLVLQTSVRQLVTPPTLLGRVGASITTTIYGVRPIGALLAGQIAGLFGAGAAVWFAVALFIASCGVLLASPASRVTPTAYGGAG